MHLFTWLSTWSKRPRLVETFVHMSKGSNPIIGVSDYRRDFPDPVHSNTDIVCIWKEGAEFIEPVVWEIMKILRLLNEIKNLLFSTHLWRIHRRGRQLNKTLRGLDLLLSLLKTFITASHGSLENKWYLKGKLFPALRNFQFFLCEWYLA